MRFELVRYWYQPKLNPILLLLTPLMFLFAVIVATRKWLYKIGFCKIKQFEVPIIVVGNITVGGTGKTPMVLWLAQFLRVQGYKPGIVSRGVGGAKQISPIQINGNDEPARVGDEALLLWQRAECPIVVCVDRVAAVQYLLEHSDCDIVISDDGLQHYRLGRNMEIAMLDKSRDLGNGYLLPVGPLRESASRLSKVDFIIYNGGTVEDYYRMDLRAADIINLHRPELELALPMFNPKTIHAVAAIGNPQRFFSLLEQAGLTIIPHIFHDHYLYQANDLQFDDSLPIVMTEKDAVKCRAFANENMWYVPVQATLNEKFIVAFLEKLKR